jgi:hypothetical protein
MGKFSTARCVVAPYNASAGTVISPMESFSIRVAVVAVRPVLFSCFVRVDLAITGFFRSLISSFARAGTIFVIGIDVNPRSVVNLGEFPTFRTPTVMLL